MVKYFQSLLVSIASAVLILFFTENSEGLLHCKLVIFFSARNSSVFAQMFENVSSHLLITSLVSKAELRYFDCN